MEPEYIGVDLHKQFFQVCALTGSGVRAWETRWPRTAEGIETFCTRCGPHTQVAVEATGPTWPFVDVVQVTGARVCVVDTRKTKLKAGFAAKTDRLDARRLADALRRDSVVSVYIPPPAIRELREVCRGRHQLTRVRTRMCQMIRALLLRNGVADVPARQVYSARALAWLKTVAVPAAARTTLDRLTHVLEAVHADAVLAQAAVVTAATTDPVAGALDALVGIGPVLGLTLRAEIGDISRFRHGRELASYAGLVPRVDASGSHYYSGHITRQGSPWIRWALVEAARHALNRQDPRGRWARRLAVRKGAMIARVALARRLCDDIVEVWP